MAHAHERGDQWGLNVSSRVLNAIDLIAAEAKYHHDCYKEFFFISKMDTKSKAACGRPEDEFKAEAFKKLCSFLDENDECQYSLSELLDHMDGYLGGKEGYTLKHLRNKLLDHYANNIAITSIPGKPSIVSFRDVAHNILQEKWSSDRYKNMEDEKNRIIEMAASIIRDDIRLTVYPCDTYPAPNSVEHCQELVPTSLLCFLGGVLNSKKDGESVITDRRSTAIAHAIIASCWPRSFISPLLLAVAVYIHRKYASKELIDMLSSMNFCVTYREVQRYEYALISKDAPTYNLEGFVQFMFDNADFNVNTIDGHNTFHSMGGIACVTPAGTVDTNELVPRVVTIPPAETIGLTGNIPVKTYTRPAVSGLRAIAIRNVIAVGDTPATLRTAIALDSLWHIGPVFEISPCPSWSGFMQVAMSSCDYDTSRIEVLPLINLDPSNQSTIYTALHFA